MPITEKQLEDFVCKHPEYMLWNEVEIIGRQIRLPHGILDVLACDGRALVVELKVCTIKEKDVGQVLRYAYDVGAEIRRLGATEDPMDYFTLKVSRAARFRDLWIEYHGMSITDYNAVIPVLIGPDITLNAKVAAAGAGIEVFLWKYNEENNTISCHSPEFLIWREGAYPDWCIEINKRIVASCLHDAAIEN